MKRSIRSSILPLLLSAVICLSTVMSGCGGNGGEKAAETTDTPVVSASNETAVYDESDTFTDVKSSVSEVSSEASKTESKTASKTESTSESKKSESKVSQSTGEKTVSGDEKNESAAESAAISEKSDDKKEYKEGQTVTVLVKFGNIAMNGSPAKIGAYDYWITYDADVLEYVSAKEATKGDLTVVNGDEPGIVKIVHVAAMGFDDDYTGEKKPTYKVTFKVKKTTTSLGMSGKCPSLTAVSMDGKDTLNLVGVKNPEDNYSEFTIE